MFYFLQYQEDVKKSLLEKVIPEDEEFVTISAKMKPLVLDTMSKFSKKSDWVSTEINDGIILHDYQNFVNFENKLAGLQCHYFKSIVLE